jgi:hypothetical protein
MGSLIEATTHRKPHPVDYFDYFKMVEAWWKHSMAMSMLKRFKSMMSPQSLWHISDRLLDISSLESTSPVPLYM